MFEKFEAEFKIEKNAAMKDLNKLNLPRYPSETLETFELWNEIFGSLSQDIDADSI